jgi:fatty-acyl-CoA synthase
MNDATLPIEASGAKASDWPMRSTPARDWMRALEATARLIDDPHRTLPVVISELAHTLGERSALLSERETLSFASLAERMNRYSRWALMHGVGPSAPVCLLMPNRPEYFAIWLGITHVGGVAALLNTNLADAGLAHCIDVAAARHIIVAAELAPAFAAAAPHLVTTPIVWLCGEAALSAPRLDRAIDAIDGSELQPSERPTVSLADRALCIYTSGTTGLPKAANVSHHRIMSWSFWFAGLADMTPDDRMYDCLPMYHSVGGVVAIGAALVRGASVVVRERFSARQFWDDVARWDCTAFQYIGELCRYLVAAPPHPAERAHRLRLACGNGMSGEVWRAFEERFAIPRILEFYAATEGNFSLYNVEGKVGAIGRMAGLLAARNPIALVKFDFAAERPQRGADGLCIRCETGEAGEAIGRISSDKHDPSARFEGYTNPAETEKKILRNVFAPGDAYMRSGDLMRLDAQGFYYFVDRIGDTFRWKGENVSTLEVAAALEACPGVAEAVVYGVAVSGAEGRAGMALLCGEGLLDLVEIAHHLRALPEYARPVFLRLGRRIETTATFKHRKPALANEGFDPARVADPLYVFAHIKRRNQALTPTLIPLAVNRKPRESRRRSPPQFSPCGSLRRRSRRQSALRYRALPTQALSALPRTVFTSGPAKILGHAFIVFWRSHLTIELSSMRAISFFESHQRESTAPARSERTNRPTPVHNR